METIHTDFHTKLLEILILVAMLLEKVTTLLLNNVVQVDQLYQMGHHVHHKFWKEVRITPEFEKIRRKFDEYSDEILLEILMKVLKILVYFSHLA